jgi:hypothetical protein
MKPILISTLKASTLGSLIIGSSVRNNRKNTPLSIDRRMIKFVLYLLITISIIPVFCMVPLIYRKKWATIKEKEQKWATIEKLWMNAYKSVDMSLQSPLQKPETQPQASTFLRDIFGLSFSKQKKDLEDEIHKDCQLLESHVQLSRKQIENFDNFVKKNKELYKVCQTYLKHYPVDSIPVRKRSTDLNMKDPIDVRTNLLIEKNNLDFCIQERMRFIKRYPEVYQAFQKSLAAYERHETL